VDGESLKVLKDAVIALFVESSLQYHYYSHRMIVAHIILPNDLFWQIDHFSNYFVTKRAIHDHG
jgi:ubiquinone biosynthesis protein COQ9